MGGGRSSLSGRRGTGVNSSTKSTKYEDFGGHYDALYKSTKFFSKNSNSDTWKNELTTEELHALQHYTGVGYKSMNKALYNTKYEDMDPHIRNLVKNAESGLGKFVLTKGITVTRQADFKIFGAQPHTPMTVEQIRDYITKNGDKGVLQSDGLLSAGANNHGAAIDGSGLVIHFKVPPSIGAGAYVNPISHLSGASENEFLFNSRSKFKFDLKSLKKGSDGKIHITATWVGRGKKQSFA